MKIRGIEYQTGQDRNEPHVVAHLYKGSFDDLKSPMCARGWNRSDGTRYSIFRNLENVKLCKVCVRRANEKRPPVESLKRKTKWL